MAPSLAGWFIEQVICIWKIMRKTLIDAPRKDVFDGSGGDEA